MDIYKTAHVVYNIKYHLVWITKYRYKKFHGRVAERTKELLLELGLEYEVPIEEISIEPDHVHIYIRMDPDDRPSKVVQVLKSQSAKVLKQEYKYLANKKGNVWGRGYFITSVNDKTTSEMIKRYIRNQKQEAKQMKIW